MKVTSHVVSSNSGSPKFRNSRSAGKKRSASTYKTVSSKAVADPKGGSGKSKSKRKSAPKSGNKGGFNFFAFLASPRMIQVYGILLLIFSLLLFLSTVSFYFHANNNISFVEGHGEVFSENIARSVGAYLAYFFVNNIFGIVSIGFTFLFFLYGLKLAADKSPVRLGHVTYTTLLTMAWLSLLLGVFFCDGENVFVCGEFGKFAGGFLLHGTGKVVTALILLTLLILILTLCYDVSLKNSFDSMHSAYDVLASKTAAAREAREEEPSKPRRNRKRKTDDEAEADYVPSGREELDDLYISDHGCLSKEYQGKQIFEFESKAQPEPAVVHQEEVPFELSNEMPTPEASTQEFVNEVLQEEFTESSVEETPAASTVEDVRDLEPYDPHLDLPNYEFPPLDLLNEYPAKEAAAEQLRKELLENKNRIESTLKSFGIAIVKITATVGPTVTLYEIIPADGVRISKIKNLEDDIALKLAALGIRIIAPIPGRGTIGIEVPNKNAKTVSMREIIASDKFQNNSFALPIGLGRTINNEPFVVDLAKMPHLLVAGATGQGKSVGLNAIITSLLYTKHPSEMKMVLIDPKKVEFTLYSAIENYYLAKLPDEIEPIITDVKKVVHTLNALCKEMDDRYDLLKLAKMRNIKEYNAKFCARELSPVAGHHYMPYIVLIIDEFGDLIMTAGREVEQPLARLAQLARAIGIHLVIATQRPSVNIITGSIKANFPARIAFRVQSGVDSKTILDATGANQLIGKGDMLISTGSDLVRLQCAFVDTPEVERIADFIQQQAVVSPLHQPYELPDVPEPGSDGGRGEEDFCAEDTGKIDPLFVDAAVLIVQTQQGSTSLIQRRMNLGYNRSARIMEQMEDFKIVGPANGSKPREVLMKTEMQLREMLASKKLI